MENNKPGGSFEFDITDLPGISKERDVSCRVISGVIKYLESQGYETDALLEGLPYSREYLCDPFNWVDYNIREIICQRAVDLTKNEAVMYHMGLSSPALKPFGGLEYLVILLGNPRIAYTSIARFSGFFDHTLKFKSTIINDKQAIVDMSLHGGYRISKNSCYFAQGLLAAVPTLWGLPPAEIHEKHCMCNENLHSDHSVVASGERPCSYEITWQSLPPLRKRLWGNLLRKESQVSSSKKKLEENFRLLDRKNGELTQKNRQLAKVREIALAIDGLRTRDQVYKTVVELSRDIPGVRFVVVLKESETGEYIIAPYYSRIRNKSILTALKAIGFDLGSALGEKPNSEKFRFRISDSKLVMEYKNDPKMVIKTSLAELMEGIWPSTLCDGIQLVANIKKIVVSPIIIDGEPWGGIVFYLNDDVPSDILEMIGAHCSSAIKNALVMEKLERHNVELAVLNRIANSISTSQGNIFVLNSGLSEIMGMYQAVAGAIYLWDEEVDRLKLAVQQGMPEDIIQRLKYSVQKDSAVFRFFSSRDEITKGMMSDYLSDLPDLKGLSDYHRSHNFITVQIKIQSQKTGLIMVVCDRTGSFSEEEILFLKSVANQLAVVLENFKLQADVLKRALEAETTNIQLQVALNRQRQAELELKQSEEKYKTIFNSVNDIMILFDNMGKAVDVNDKFKEITGFDREYLIGRDNGSLARVMPEKNLTIISNNYQMLLAGSETAPFELEMMRQNGTKATLEVTVLAMRKDRNLAGFLAIAKDITIRKETQDRVQVLYEKEKQQRLELEAEARDRAMFIDILAHELRTPLTPMMISVDLLHDLVQTRPDALYTRLADTLSTSTANLAGRLEELLEVARYARGTFKLNKKHSDIRLLINDIVSRFRTAFDRSHQVLNLDMAENVSSGLFDPSRIEQVIGNLLSNAGKFSPPGSTISILINQPDDQLHVEVKDQGIGISIEDQKKLFQPYHRVQQDRSIFPGTGLGLAVCKQIIEAHGGNIWCKSEPGRGSIFGFDIPIK
jgi:PAS domain S-box-containing protein